MVSSKSNAPLIRNVFSSYQVAEYHIPPRILSHTMSPSRGINLTSVESPGIPVSLNSAVCLANNII